MGKSTRARVLNQRHAGSPERHLCCWPRCLQHIEVDGLPLCDIHAHQVWRYWTLSDRSRTAIIRQWIDDDRDLTAKREKAERGHVYFLRFADRIKIGWTSNPKERLSSHPYDEVIAIVPGTMDDEKGLHKRFAHLRHISGKEWFRSAPELEAYLRFIKTRSVA